MDKMKSILTFAQSPLILVFILFIRTVAGGDARARVIQLTCSDQWQQNSGVSVPNFVATMVKVNAKMQASGFGAAITGTGPDSNYALGQCYGDLSLTDCSVCFAEARTFFPRCFPHNGARLYLDGCFLRSENYSFFAENIGPHDRIVCGNSTQRSPNFIVSTRRAVLQAAAEAPNNKGYARVGLAMSTAANDSAYVLANCWRTLNASYCRKCLQNASSSILRCLPSSEGRALYSGCFLRYSDINFLNALPTRGGSKGTAAVIVPVVVCTVVAIVAGLGIGLYLWKQRGLQNKRSGKHDAEKMAMILRDSSLNFKFSTLEKATGSFDAANKLGQGGFGTVYKGVLGDGREIAVKRLFFNNKHRAGDFYNEVNIISSVQHTNLVRLLGCCCSGPESLLVYEYLPNNSLHHLIFDEERGIKLDWEKRHEIIMGTTEGLAYLHENPNNKIIHRDIKASNILLDSRFRAKIADFGLARSFEGDKSHISTGIAGTLGYMAPEYIAHGQLTEKADVYSFGVLLMEIVTGRQNNKVARTSEFPESLVITVWKQFQEQTMEELIDPDLGEENHKEDIKRVLHIALLCCQEAPSLRPTMSGALKLLKNKDEELPAPANPPFVDDETMEFTDTNEDDNLPLTATSSSTSINIMDFSKSVYFPR